MGFFTKESLERLREKLDLIELLSSYLDLKKNGLFYKALCPFHEEKTPSFSVKSNASFYHCFGCGAHGDAIQFLMQHLHLSFADAVEFLAERYHVILEKSEKEDKESIDKFLLKEALKEASLFFHCFLLYSKEGEEALLYLLKRGLSLSFINKFEIGLAPKHSGLLSKILKEKGIEEIILKESGLLSKKREEEFFKERITFPIRDKSGLVIGFSARKFKEETPGGKYINSPETAIFKKSRILFGLNYSLRKIVKEKKVYVVEGQIDCLRLIDSGFDLSVASLGTAFGQEHVHDLERLGIKEAILLFDGDDAGAMAASKAGNFFQAKGIDVKVVCFSKGYDPDTFLKKEGVDRLKQEILKGKDYLTYQIDFLSKTYDIRTPAGKNEIVTQLKEQINLWEEPIMVHESLKRLAFLTKIPEEMLGLKLEMFPSYERTSLSSSAIDYNKILEFDLLRWLLLVGKEKEEVPLLIAKYIQSDHFFIPIAKKIYEIAIKSFIEKKECDFLSLLIEIDEKEGPSYLEEILNKKINKERYLKYVQETIQKMLDRDWLKRSEEIALKIKICSEESLLDLMKQLDFIKKNRPVVKL